MVAWAKSNVVPFLGDRPENAVVKPSKPWPITERLIPLVTGSILNGRIDVDSRR